MLVFASGIGSAKSVENKTMKAKLIFLNGRRFFIFIPMFCMSGLRPCK
jgi:hypothetical protein